MRRLILLVLVLGLLAAGPAAALNERQHLSSTEETPIVVHVLRVLTDLWEKYGGFPEPFGDAGVSSDSPQVRVRNAVSPEEKAALPPGS